MKIGETVRTIDGKEGKIDWIDESTTPERSRKCAVLYRGEYEYYLLWQLTVLTPIPKKPKAAVCWRKLWGCKLCDSLTARCLKDDFCVDQWHPSSYAKRLQWAYVGTEHIFCPKCNKAIYEGHQCEESKEPPNSLYICEKAKECHYEDCPSIKLHPRSDACSARCMTGAKCIPVEEKDWFVMTHTQTINGPYWSQVGQNRILSKDEAIEMAKQWGGRAFKWGVDSIDIYYW